jgi:hypothetical protein
MYTVELDSSYNVQFITLQNWCSVNLGSGNWGEKMFKNNVWGFDCYFGKTFFYFKNEADSMWFTLTWL